MGDAAGVDPLFGEGIGVGLGYGAEAAGAIRRAAARGDFTFANYRRRLLTSSVGRYLMPRWLVASIAYRLGGVDMFVRGLWSAGELLAPLANRTDPSPALRPPLRSGLAREAMNEDTRSIRTPLADIRS